MIVQTFVLTAFQQNTRIVACGRTRKAICIDPGQGSDDLEQFIESNGLELQAVALTHGHLDHVGGTADLVERFPEAEVRLHKDDEDLYYGLPHQPLFLGIDLEQARQLGMAYDAPPRVTRNWEHNEKYRVGELEFSVLHCPGHTRGHVVLAEKKEKAVFVGDCLFEGSIGRTDLPGGSSDQLMDSIENNILTLGDDFTVYSGHGRDTTIGKEKRSNPFLTGAYSIARGRYI
jgi:hydroxyacylglutathione hydrolase